MEFGTVMHVHAMRDLVRHVVQEQQWVPQLLAGLTIPQAKRQLARLGDDLRAEWRLYSLAATAAWDAAKPDTLVALSYDTVPVAEYLREQTSDVAIHAWDLARATGADESLDPLLVEAVWTVFEPQKDTLVASVKKTNRAVVAHEAVTKMGFGAEVAAVLQYQAFDYLDAPIERVGAKFAPLAFAPVMEQFVVPHAEDVLAAIKRTVGK